MRTLKKYGLNIAGGIIGATGGFLYWKFVGCSTGTCPLTSSPVSSVVVGVLMGVLLFSMFNKTEKKQ